MIPYCICMFLVTLILVYLFTKKIIIISHEKHLFDEPSEVRKIHLTRTPNLGGVAIFASIIIASCLLLPVNSISHLNYVIFSSLILFVLGLTDDLVGVNPTKKFIAQLVAALSITLLADYRFTSCYGLFGIHEIPFALSVTLSTVFIIFLINAFNLIDGINCLAGCLGLLASLILHFIFGNYMRWALCICPS